MLPSGQKLTLGLPATIALEVSPFCLYAPFTELLPILSASWKSNHWCTCTLIYLHNFCPYRRLHQSFILNIFWCNSYFVILFCCILIFRLSWQNLSQDVSAAPQGLFSMRHSLYTVHTNAFEIWLLFRFCIVSLLIDLQCILLKNINIISKDQVRDTR